MQIRQVSFKAMGCPCELKFFHENDDQAQIVADLCIEEARRFEQKYSRYLASSVTSQINAAAGDKPIETDAETAALLDYADACFRESRGLFDITSGVLRQVWRHDRQSLPEPQELVYWLGKLGWEKVERTAHTVFLPEKGMELDLGGLVKEYAADALAAILGNQGVEHGLVSLGGDIATSGSMPGGEPWGIGISDPRSPGQAIAMVDLHQGAIATSGGYERFIEIDGKRYSHLLNPQTGFPADCLLSVTAVAPGAVVAGAICSIALLMEQQEGLDFLAESGVRYLAVDTSGNCHGTVS